MSLDNGLSLWSGPPGFKHKLSFAPVFHCLYYCLSPRFTYLGACACIFAIINVRFIL